MQNLPLDYIKKMQELLGNEYDKFIETYASECFQGFRINPLKIGTLDFVKDLATQLHFELKNVPWCPTGYYYPSDRTLSKHPFYHAGLYYIQEPSAMAPVEWMDVRPGMKVLDLCAAPGGKSIQIAGKLQNLGLLVSNDISLKRAKAILKNVEISGVTNCIITNSEPAQLAMNFSDFFDRILVDAPCSGEGMFRKDPNLIKSYHEVLANITSMQAEILEQASLMLKPGGRLVYSTCTFNKEENEEIIKNFIKNHPDFDLVDPFEHSPEAILYGFSRGIEIPSARLLPHQLQGEGHFIAILEKSLSHPLEKSCLQEPNIRKSLSQSMHSMSEKPQEEIISNSRKKKLNENFFF
ncbi:MAG: RsmB/NOP family class I SAM-dependent RNA methyltransferase [Peptostreptococcaceae bacterium]|nr:RsmB/NOP family class I SAM-dependent RNA methyltransferase [Peptostreptococcaceae bacterium]